MNQLQISEHKRLAFRLSDQGTLGDTLFLFVNQEISKPSDGGGEMIDRRWMLISGGGKVVESM